MTPSHAVKNGVRYRYYISSVLIQGQADKAATLNRAPAAEIETLIIKQFNTTTSMGRLTLNVLLSFAQFEREVTSERIRDKIGASKRKGLLGRQCGSPGLPGQG